MIKTKKLTNQRIQFKKVEDDSYVCTSCGYSGHGKVDEETRELLCPECGSNLEENDLLRMKTPNSYEGDENSGLYLGDDKLSKDFE